MLAQQLSHVQLFATPFTGSPPGFSVHGDSPGKSTRVGCHALFQGIFPTQGLNPGLLHCRWILYHLSHQEDQEYWSGYPIPSPGVFMYVNTDNHIGESLPRESMNQQSAPQNPILCCFYFPDCVAGNLLLLITFNNIFIFNIYNLLLEFDIHHPQVLPYLYRFGTTFSETPYNELLAPFFKSEIYLWPFSMR